MAFSADDFIVKIALQVDDSQLKQAMKDIDALGLSSHNKASSRAANQNSEFVGPPQRVRQHAYDSDPDRPGQGKDNLRNKRIRAQTSLDFLRWPGVIAAGVTTIAYPLIKLYQLTERSFADLLVAVKGLKEKASEANLSERDVLIAENINSLTDLPKGEILKGLTRIAQINAELQDFQKYPGTKTNLGIAEVKGFHLGRTLKATTALDQLKELRSAVSGLSIPQSNNFAEQFGLSKAMIGWLRNTDNEIFARQTQGGIEHTLSSDELKISATARRAKQRQELNERYLSLKKGARDAGLKIQRSDMVSEYISNQEPTLKGQLNTLEYTLYTKIGFFLLEIFKDIYESASYKTPTLKQSKERSRIEEEEDRQNKKQPISMTLNINGQLKDGTMNFTEELMVNNTQTFIADIDGTA